MERQKISIKEGEQFERLKRIAQVVEQSGLQSDERHKFRLTPDRLELDMDCLRQFQAIGDFCVSYFKGLEMIYQKALRREFPSDMNEFVRDAVERTLTKGQRRLQQEEQLGQPLMFRTDCVLAKDRTGKRRVFVTEIEGERPIGLGFEQLANKMSQVISELNGDQVVRPMGGVEGLRIVLEENKERFRDQAIAVILGEDQLFYIEEQSFFMREAQSAGIPIELVREKDLNVDTEGVLLPGLGTRTRVLMCLPVFNIQKSNKVAQSRELFHKTLAGRFDFMQPPKKFFGTKAGLGLLFIPFLQQFFIEQGVDPKTIMENIPKSKLITVNCFETERLMIENGQRPKTPVMIKAIGRSAARGMALPHDTVALRDLLRQAHQKPFEFMTQEFIDTEGVEFNIFDVKADRMVREPQFMRLTAYFINSGGNAVLTEVEGTGIDSQLVHGNPRCIFFPVAFK